MRFWLFGASKKSRQPSVDGQAGNTLLEKERGGNGMMARTSARPVRDDDKSRKLAKSREPSYQSNSRILPRAQTSLSNTGTPEVSEKSPQPRFGLSRRASHLYQHNPTSQSSIGPEDFSAVPRAPTLYAKRQDFDPSLPRKKSSKRRADDYAREREIQAMSAPIPIPKPKRPATYSGSGLLARDTKEIPGSLNRRLSRPTSQVSLPRQEDIEGHGPAPSAFKVGVFSALSPRPTVKYDSHPRAASGKQPMRQGYISPPIVEEDLSQSTKRIDDLADGLDSGGIRELMERDRRRREKKKESDKAKLQRRLQRKADKQREEETRRTRAAEFVSESSKHLPSDVADDIEPVGEGPGPAVDENVPLSHSEQDREAVPQKQDPFADPPDATGEVEQIRNPFEDEKDLDIMQEPSPDDEQQGPPIPGKSPLRKLGAEATYQGLKPSQGALSPPTSPPRGQTDANALSQPPALGGRLTPDVAESIERDRRSSDQSAQQMGSWTNFFRRGGRRKSSTADRGRATPSEFSNTSRESFARKQPPPIVPVGRTFRRSDAATPQRTMSKFREDLPELPLSPPDSRVQSPEVAGSSLSSKHIRQSLSGTLDGKSLATSSSNPTLDKRPDSRVQSGHTVETDPSTPDPPGHVLSQSLASVDSEASWLSGKPAKRSSGLGGQSFRQSGASMTPQPPGAFEQEEEDDITKDEYLNQLSPPPEDRRQSAVTVDRKASSTLIDLQKEGESSPVPEVPPLADLKDEKWHEGVARQPTVVRQARQAKSREGLLKEYDEAADISSGDEAELPMVEEPVQLMRAKSVDYKGHVRHVSAGSARLLDIRRSSTVSADTPPRSPALPQAIANVEQKSTSTPKL